MRAIETEGLAKKVGAERQLFADLSLTVERGEVVAITGESGVGKSTLLNILAGLDNADRGNVRIEGIALDPLDETARTKLRRERIGFVFKPSTPFPISRWSRTWRCRWLSYPRTRRRRRRVRARCWPRSAWPIAAATIAQGLAIGSGFWAIQPGLNFLLPSDPVVIFSGLSYLYQIPKTVGRTVGTVYVGRVEPGGAINGNIGFGFALNPRFSFSLGYQHSYILPMRSTIDGFSQRASALQGGSLALGMSYRLTERQSLNITFDVGATKDAPDIGVVLRMPFTTK